MASHPSRTMVVRVPVANITRYQWSIVIKLHRIVHYGVLKHISNTIVYRIMVIHIQIRVLRVVKVPPTSRRHVKLWPKWRTPKLPGRPRVILFCLRDMVQPRWLNYSLIAWISKRYVGIVFYINNHVRWYSLVRMNIIPIWYRGVKRDVTLSWYPKISRHRMWIWRYWKTTYDNPNMINAHWRWGPLQRPPMWQGNCVTSIVLPRSYTNTMHWPHLIMQRRAPTRTLIWIRCHDGPLTPKSVVKQAQRCHHRFWRKMPFSLVHTKWLVVWGHQVYWSLRSI